MVLSGSPVPMNNTLIIKYRTNSWGYKLISDVETDYEYLQSVPVSDLADIPGCNSINVTDALISELNSYNIKIIDATLATSKSLTAGYDLYASILHPLFKGLKINYQYQKTESANSIEHFASQLSSNIYQEKKNLLLFISGDTTIFEFLNFLYPSFKHIENITILPFPHGTGNALSHSNNCPTDIHCLAKLFNFRPVHLPLYEFRTNSPLKSMNPKLSKFSQNDSIYFLLVASWCLHSTLVHESDKPELRSKYGNERFKIAAQNILNENPRFKGNLTFNPDNKSLIYKEVDGWNENEIISDFMDFSYFVLTSISHFEKNFQISPESSLFQDELHILSIPYLEKSSQIMDIMMQAYDSGKHIANEKVFYKKLANDSFLDLRIADEMQDALSIFCLDGSSWQIVGTNRKVSFLYFDQSFLNILC